jgi:hypothetical protein
MSIRWTIKQDGVTHIMPNPGDRATNRDIGAAKNYLRKHSRKADAIFRARGL